MLTTSLICFLRIAGACLQGVIDCGYGPNSAFIATSLSYNSA